MASRNAAPGRKLFIGMSILLAAFLLAGTASATTRMVPVPLDPLPGPGPLDADSVRVDPAGREYVVGEVVVSFGDGLDQARIDRVSAPMRRQLDLELEENLGEINAQVMNLGDEISEQEQSELIARIDSRPGVEDVQLNYVEKPFTNDPFYSQQWWLPRIGAPEAWARTTGRVKIAVLDSGVDVSHPDIGTTTVTHWYDYVSHISTAWDYSGHGTHVTGIAAALTDNGVGVAGTAPGATVYMAKVCDLYDDGETRCPQIAAIEAILDLAGSGVPVFNMSLGGYNYNQTYADAIAYAASLNHTIVVAAGNDATDSPSYPAAYPGALSVSATDPQDGDADYSNYGSWVDISAPGGEGEGENKMVSTYPTSLGTGYAYLQGTSMATPVVSGVAAMLSQQGYSGAALTGKLLATARDVGAAGRDNLFGCGIVDANAATLTSTPATGCGRTIAEPENPTPIVPTPTVPVTPTEPYDPAIGTYGKCSAARKAVTRAKAALKRAKSNLKFKQRYGGYRAVRTARTKVRKAKSKLAFSKRRVRIYC